MDKNKFFRHIKTNGLFKTLAPTQVDGIEAIINECEAQFIRDERQIAYILGTVYHAVGQNMKPISETGKGENKNYGQRTWYNGQPYDDVPWIYYGRGYTQNTWRDIYRALTAAAQRSGHDWDFENKPELLLQVEPSAWASVFAMRTGLYTGEKLSIYFTTTTTDYLNARRVAVGTKPGEEFPAGAELVADYAKRFCEAMS
jgi:putative chitinase